MIYIILHFFDVPLETWPNFFIVGAPRCGTTSLWYYLNQSPEIFMSSKKEPWYFNSPEYVNVYPEKPIHNDKKYLSLFKGVLEEKAVGEASTTYLADPTTPERIHSVLPESRIIISIRDPVERAFSSYLMILERRLTKLSLRNILESKENVVKKNPIIREIFDPGFYFRSVFDF